MSRPALRKLILDLRHKFEQVVDEVSKDELIADQTGYSPEAREKAAALVHSFEQYLTEVKAGHIETLYDPKRAITSGPGYVKPPVAIAAQQGAGK